MISNEPAPESAADAPAPAFTEEQSRTISDALTALTCPTRLTIFLTLCVGGGSTVDKLVQRLGLAQSTTSHHLGQLKLHGLLAARRQGQNVWYEAAPRVCSARRPIPGAAANGGDTDEELTITIGRAHNVTIEIRIPIPAAAMPAAADPLALRSAAA
jgi:DNA-binding transcriptional ArsR family regulator